MYYSTLPTIFIATTNKKHSNKSDYNHEMNDVISNFENKLAIFNNVARLKKKNSERSPPKW